MDSILYIIIAIVAIIIAIVGGLFAWNYKKQIKEMDEAREAEIKKNIKKADEILNEHKQKAKEFLPLIKDFIFDYSHITESGTVVHVFNYLDKYTMVIWETNNNPFGFEVSIHSIKDNKKSLVLADGKDIVSNPIIFAALKNFSEFIAKIRIKGNGESNAYQQGNLDGYKSGYVAGYLRGWENNLQKVWNFPNEKEMIDDLAVAAEKIEKNKKKNLDNSKK